MRELIQSKYNVPQELLDEYLANAIEVDNIRAETLKGLNAFKAATEDLDLIASVLGQEDIA